MLSDYAKDGKGAGPPYRQNMPTRSIAHADPLSYMIKSTVGNRLIDRYIIKSICIFVYMYICIYEYMNICIYIYREREK